MNKSYCRIQVFFENDRMERENNAMLIVLKCSKEITAFELTATHHRYEIPRYLLSDTEVDINHKLNTSNTALHCAQSGDMINGQKEMQFKCVPRQLSTGNENCQVTNMHGTCIDSFPITVMDKFISNIQNANKQLCACQHKIR